MGTCYDIVNDGVNNYTQTGNPDMGAFSCQLMPFEVFLMVVTSVTQVSNSYIFYCGKFYIW